MSRLLLLKPFFQGRSVVTCQIHPGHAVFRREDKGLGQIVTGDDHALLLRPAEEFLGPLGGGGVVHVEYSYNGPVSYRHIVSD